MGSINCLLMRGAKATFAFLLWPRILHDNRADPIGDDALPATRGSQDAYRWGLRPGNPTCGG